VNVFDMTEHSDVVGQMCEGVCKSVFGMTEHSDVEGQYMTVGAKRV